MPRSQLSPTGRIVNFFRTADLDTAQVVLDLCKDAVLERKHKSDAAKARTKSASADVPAPPAAPKKRQTKPRKAKPRKAKAVQPALPGTTDLAENEAGDAPAGVAGSTM